MAVGLEDIRDAEGAAKRNPGFFGHDTMEAARRFPWAVAGVLAVSAAPLLAAKAVAPDNIALKAKVTATSEHSAPHLAKFAADGKIPALGKCNGAGRSARFTCSGSDRR